MRLIEIQNLKYKYPDGHEALKGVSFALNSGEKVALVGANGSGKSTLLLHIAGALQVTDGEIFLRGEPVNGNKIEALRKSVGLIFQEPDDQLLMPSVLEDVAFGPVANGMNIQKAHESAVKILASLEISHLADRPPHKLSGGEKRMVSLAGILASEPEILALDEPTAALDPRARRRVINFLQKTDKTVLLASHDLDMALDVCERAVILHNGKVSAEGNLPALFTNEELLENNGLELPLRYSR